METLGSSKEDRTDDEIFHWVYFFPILGGQTVGGISHLTILGSFKEGQTVYKIFNLATFGPLRERSNGFVPFSHANYLATIFIWIKKFFLAKTGHKNILVQTKQCTKR